MNFKFSLSEVLRISIKELRLFLFVIGSFSYYFKLSFKAAKPMNASKSLIYPMPKFFDRYIHIVREEDLMDALKNSLNLYLSMDFNLLEKIGTKTYETGKWTVKEILVHITDNERIQSYRAMRFARNDNTSLPGYDEALLASYSDANKRSLEDIKNEFFHVRNASIELFKGLTKEAILRKGVCFNTEISALALGFVLVGHQEHHIKVIEGKYTELALL